MYKTVTGLHKTVTGLYKTGAGLYEHAGCELYKVVTQQANGKCTIVYLPFVCWVTLPFTVVAAGVNQHAVSSIFWAVIAWQTCLAALRQQLHNIAHRIPICITCKCSICLLITLNPHNPWPSVPCFCSDCLCDKHVNVSCICFWYHTHVVWCRDCEYDSKNTDNWHKHAYHTSSLNRNKKTGMR